jgi:hypothetical protein
MKLIKIISEIKQMPNPSSVINMGEFDKLKDPEPGEGFLKWLRRNDMPPIWAEHRKGRNGNDYFSTKIKITKFIDRSKFDEYLELLPGQRWEKNKYTRKISLLVAQYLQQYFDNKFGEGKFKVVVTNDMGMFSYIYNVRIYTQTRPKHTKM